MWPTWGAGGGGHMRVGRTAHAQPELARGRHIAAQRSRPSRRTMHRKTLVLVIWKKEGDRPAASLQGAQDGGERWWSNAAVLCVAAAPRLQPAPATSIAPVPPPPPPLHGGEFVAPAVEVQLVALAGILVQQAPEIQAPRLEPACVRRQADREGWGKAGEGSAGCGAEQRPRAVAQPSLLPGCPTAAPPSPPLTTCSRSSGPSFRRSAAWGERQARWPRRARGRWGAAAPDI